MAIKHQKVSSLKQKLDGLFALSKQLSEESIELRSHWARYLCIQTSGFLEVSIQYIFLDYIKSHSAPKLHSYITRQIRNFRNPKFKKIEDLAKSFDEDWGIQLNNIQEYEQIKAAIDSLVELRNKIAHGADTPSGRISTIQEYYPRVVRCIEALEDLIQ